MTIYNTYVFDFDGVILDSNRAKEMAFYHAALKYGTDDDARKLVDYHRNAGAIGRRARIDYFFESILGQSEIDEAHVDAMFNDVTKRVNESMYHAKLIRGAHKFVAYTAKVHRALCVSGIEQEELETLLRQAHLYGTFKGRIYGTNDKTSTLYKLVQEGVIEQPAVYYGDTEDDYRAARSAGLDFVLVYGGQAANSPLRAIRDFREYDS